MQASRRPLPAPKNLTPAPAPRPALVRRAPPRPAASVAPPPQSFRAETPVFDFDDVLGSSMFDSLARVRALPAQPGVTALALTSLAEARGYTREELLALAEIGYHYLFSGGHRIALTIFEGLSVIAPAEPYFALALGLCYDRLDRLLDARRAYGRACELAPHDPRPEINLAELEIEQNELLSATRRLARAVQLAKRSGEAALGAKAATLLARIAPRKGR